MASEFARRLRQDMTEEERILWSELRRKQVMGLRFRRQVPLGSYVVDFACLEHRFIVEIDGLQHRERENQVRDEIRTAWLEAQGFRVFRAWNGEIRDNLNGVIESMLGEMGLLNPPMQERPLRVAEVPPPALRATSPASSRRLASGERGEEKPQHGAQNGKPSSPGATT